MDLKKFHREIIEKQEIKIGYTNRSYFLKSKNEKYFYQIFDDDKFNHLIDFKLLTNFSFVPTTFYSDHQVLISKYIVPDLLKITPTFLKQAANILKEIHQSSLPFPSNNIIKRVDQYWQIIKEKNQPIPEVIKGHYSWVYNLIKEQKSTVPSHNDPWVDNFISSDGKIYLADWEYATMNDKHFDLAFFIDGSQLTTKQETIFLDQYCDYDPPKLLLNKIIVNFLTLLWIWKLPTKPYSSKVILDNFLKYVNEYKKLKSKNG